MYLAAGPQITVTGWVTWLILAGSVATAFVAIAAFMSRVLVPLTTVISQIQRDFPIWTEIAERFNDEHGGETISAELKALSANDQVSAANQRAMMAQLETVITQAKATDERLSETRHKIIGEFVALRAVDGSARTLVQAIADTGVVLREVQRELAELKGTTP